MWLLLKFLSFFQIKFNFLEAPTLFLPAVMAIFFFWPKFGVLLVLYNTYPHFYFVLVSNISKEKYLALQLLELPLSSQANLSVIWCWAHCVHYRFFRALLLAIMLRLETDKSMHESY